MDLEMQGFEGYELVGSGNGRKLERFGQVLLDRPAAQAIWPASHGAKNRAEKTAVFQRGEKGTGDWEVEEGAVQDKWRAAWQELSFDLRLTQFGNVGLFPEHAVHWQWMSDLIKRNGGAEVLNLFAYTGSASALCAKAGAKVTHLDSAKSVNNWAALNAGLCRVKEGAIRYIADDAAKFAKRESRRGRRYDAIIIDPPTFGRGPKGEVWKIERDLNPLVDAIFELMTSSGLFVLLTCHSPGITPRVLRALLEPHGGSVESGEMLLKGGGPPLPAGSYARWRPGSTSSISRCRPF